MEQLLEPKAIAATFLEHRFDKDYVFMRLVDEISIAEAKAAKRQRELELAREAEATGQQYPVTPEFNPRALLYFLTEIAEPLARQDNPQAVIEWIKAQPGQRIVDIGSGTGIISRALAKMGCHVYAVDASDEQLDYQQIGIEMDLLEARQTGRPLPRGYRRLITMVNQDFSRPLPIRSGVHAITSYGCIHHLGVEPQVGNHFNIGGKEVAYRNDQATLWQEAARLLLQPKNGQEGGIFGAADVGKDTPLEQYFIDEVSPNCLTGHKGIFLDERLIKSYCVGQPLEFVRAEVINRPWGPFIHPRDIPMFFMGLHGYTHKPEKVIEGLDRYLKIEKEPDGYYVNWPMLFFEIRRTRGKVV